MPTATQAKKDPKPGKVPVYIDGAKYIAPVRELTGAQLRMLTSPPVGEDRDLWLEVVDDLDKLVGDDEKINLEPNMRFFTVPRVINPGLA